jgi:hypothetical protein
MNGLPSSSPLRRKPIRADKATPGRSPTVDDAMHAVRARESSAMLLIVLEALAPCSLAMIASTTIAVCTPLAAFHTMRETSEFSG